MFPDAGNQRGRKMISLINRFVMVVALLFATTVIPIVAHGALVLVDEGSITSGNGGIIVGGDWESVATDVSLGWSISDTGSAYQYNYYFESPTPSLSHFILQVSDNFNTTNIIQISDAGYELGDFSGENPSNPGMDVDPPLYGIKYEGFGEEGTAFTLTLLSDRAPMLGDFYAKGGEDSFAFNSGYGDRVGANILVPDTVSHPVPEPGTMLLLGSGLIGIAGWGRKRFRK